MERAYQKILPLSAPGARRSQVGEGVEHAPSSRRDIMFIER